MSQPAADPPVNPSQTTQTPPAGPQDPVEPKAEPKSRKPKEPTPSSDDHKDFLEQIDKRVGETVHKILDERVAPEPSKTDGAPGPGAPAGSPGADTEPEKPSLADRLLSW